MNESATDRRLESLLEGARLHGENSEMGHEVGDLAELLSECWSLMLPAQRDALIASDIGQAVIQEGMET